MPKDKYPPPDERWIRIGENAYKCYEMTTLKKNHKHIKINKEIKNIMNEIIENVINLCDSNNIHTGSSIAKSGFKAEDIFVNDVNIRNKLEKYFKKGIQKIDKVPGRKKADTIITFNDNSRYRIQNKKIEQIGHMGHSYDRRKLSDTFDDQFIKKYLAVLCLFRPSPRKTNMDPEKKKDFIKLCISNMDNIKNFIRKTLIGSDEDQNDYFCIMHTNKTFENIELYCIPSLKFLEYIYNTLKIHISLRNAGTCLHLSKNIYLQRKGGGKTDHSANDIQSKIKIDQIILDLCDKL